VHFGLHRQQRRKGEACLLEDGAAGVHQAVLRQIADGQIGGLDDVAAVAFLEPGEHLEQRRLAGAVGTAERNALAVVNLPGHPVEQDALAERLGERRELDHAYQSNLSCS
jgi:hypothetical protein